MNNKQFEAIGNLFLDLCKSLIITNFGVVIFTPIKLFSIILIGIVALGCAYTGLYFLGKIKQ